MGLVAKIRNLLTGEPEDPVRKAEWLAEKARDREENPGRNIGYRLGPSTDFLFRGRKLPK